MAQQRVLSALYLIGLFRTTLFITLRERFYIFVEDSFGDSALNRQIVVGLYNILIEFIVILSMYWVVNKNTNPNLVPISNPKFRKEVSIYSIIYLLGNLTLTMILIIIYYSSGISSASNFHLDILSLFGLFDFNYLFLDTPFILISELKYFLVSLVWGIFSGMYTIIILITFNILHLQSQNTQNEILYPVK